MEQLAPITNFEFEQLESVAKPHHVSRYGVTALYRHIGRDDRDDGAGRIGAGEESLLIGSDGSIRTLDNVRAIVSDEG